MTKTIVVVFALLSSLAFAQNVNQHPESDKRIPMQAGDLSCFGTPDRLSHSMQIECKSLASGKVIKTKTLKMPGSWTAKRGAFWVTWSIDLEARWRAECNAPGHPTATGSL